MGSGRSTAWSGRVQRTFGGLENTVDMADHTKMQLPREDDNIGGPKLLW